MQFLLPKEFISEVLQEYEEKYEKKIEMDLDKPESITIIFNQISKNLMNVFLKE